jgi:hypothetical protein
MQRSQELYDLLPIRWWVPAQFLIIHKGLEVISLTRGYLFLLLY